MTIISINPGDVKNASPATQRDNFYAWGDHLIDDTAPWCFNFDVDQCMLIIAVSKMRDGNRVHITALVLIEDAIGWTTETNLRMLALV